MFRTIPALLLTVSATALCAEPPRVLVDTAPVHSLVAQVMAGVGTPDLLLPPGASPHGFQLRPSDAARLTDAGLVIWVGHGLTPWLEEPVATLATDAMTLELLESDGWDKLDVREDVAFEADHDDHTEAEDHDEHAHEGTDPHAWLDPATAAVWLDHIAGALTAADPDNAAVYQANATAAQARIAALTAEIAAELAPVQGRPYIVPHDAYQYFETSFGMPAAGAIALSDAATPGPARIAELRDRVAAGNIACILTDPQTSAEWSAVLQEGALTKTAMVDPDGTSMTVGPDLYDQILRSISAALVDCLS